VSPTGVIGSLFPNISLQLSYLDPVGVSCAASVLNASNSPANSTTANNLQAAGVIGIVGQTCRNILTAADRNSTLPLMFMGQGFPSETATVYPNVFTVLAPGISMYQLFAKIAVRFNWQQAVLLTCSSISATDSAALQAANISWPPIEMAVGNPDYPCIPGSAPVSIVYASLQAARERASPFIMLDA
jgi:hypothetical protein